MSELNDLRLDLETDIDLSDSINLESRVSKRLEKNTLDLKKGLKNLNLRKKKSFKVSQSETEKIDTIFEGQKKPIINIKPKQKNYFKKQIAKTKFHLEEGKRNLKKKMSLKNFDFTYPKFEKKETKQRKRKEFRIKGDQLNYKRFFLIGIIGVIAILFLGLLDKILLEINLRSGYQRILNIRANVTDIAKAKEEIKKAEKNFFYAGLYFAPISFLPHHQVENVSHLIKGGKELTKLIDESMIIGKKLNSIIKRGDFQSINYADFFGSIRTQSENINNLIYNTLWEYQKVKNLGSRDLDEKIQKAKTLLEQALIFIDILNKNYDNMLSLLGNNEERRYLIVFQNNDEIRPTGGFMGSFATITLNNGKIRKIDKKDVYAYEWVINKFYKDKEKAPEGLNKITPTFGLRDANYYPLTKDSSDQIKFFFDKIAYNIDGIIYINQNLIKDMIDTIGFVDSTSVGEVITKENFSRVISTLVEAEVSRVGAISTPKQVLFDFSEEFYAKLLNKGQYYDYLKVVLENIKTRDIVFYSFHPQENSLLWKLGLNGEINFKQTLDFSYPVYTSIGGNKSDRFMKYHYKKNIDIEKSCDILTTLTLNLKNTYTDEEEAKVKEILSKYESLGKHERDILNIQGRIPNKSYLRVLLPKEASVALKEGQNFLEETNYNMVSLYTETAAGKESQYQITYRVPNKSCKPYDYKFFKQPGIEEYDISFTRDNETKNYEDIHTDFVYK